MRIVHKVKTLLVVCFRICSCSLLRIELNLHVKNLKSVFRSIKTEKQLLGVF
jgi:hypothetical protein